ncbi:MAG: class F sortase [Actinomycetota bacterium]
MQPNRLATIALTFALVGAACSGSGGSDETGSGVVVPPTAASAAVSEQPAPLDRSESSAPSADDTDDTDDGARAAAAASVDDSGAATVADVAADRPLSPLADQIRSVGDIRFDPTADLADPGPRPVGLTIDGINVSDVPIRDVGVEPNGEMEIPGATEVGWYRWSPSPGREGSSVLAAHIAWNGRDGVFRNLDDLEVGDRFTVRYDDGTEREFEITEKGQYEKEELPFDRVFSKTGEPSVVLITCGGDFNRGLNSYQDNVVAYADPV